MSIKKIRLLTLSFLFLCNMMSVSATSNSMSFRERDGHLYYKSANTDRPTSFIINEDMQNGVIYSDSMIIENQTKDSYNLYLQLLPPSGLSEEAMELLDSIQMKLHIGDKKLYEGTAAGLVNKELTDLTKLTSLGEYDAGGKQELRVEYVLTYYKELNSEQAYYVKSQYEQWQGTGFSDNEKPSSYASQSLASNAAADFGEKEIIYVEKTVFDGEPSVKAITQWQFYAEKTGSGSVTPVKPDTGDDSQVPYLVLISLSVGAVMLMMKHIAKRRVVH